eukprot:TRINITY_DN6069_c0_g6_i2.p2 TRINITY_DN6069_c0_g6~~TRINITY_DN6069_c0_g6_i2.p2  ORF type:complete len:166 (+),score=21.89 TRINITY_DN6069_c0_g6_i2:768-1265(+)
MLNVMKRCGTAMSYEEMAVSLPFGDITKEQWENYENLAEGTPSRVSAGEFWRKKEPDTLATLRELALDLIAISATNPDSALSVAKRVLPSCRGNLSLQTRRQNLFHACNQDLAKKYDVKLRFRTGFPATRDEEQMDDHDDAHDKDTSDMHTFEESMTFLSSDEWK